MGLQCGSVHYPAESGIREYSFYEGAYLVYHSVHIDGLCHSNIHMNGSSQRSPAEHCPKHQTASTGLPPPHSAPWGHQRALDSHDCAPCCENRYPPSVELLLGPLL